MIRLNLKVILLFPFRNLVSRQKCKEFIWTPYSLCLFLRLGIEFSLPYLSATLTRYCVSEIVSERDKTYFSTAALNRIFPFQFSNIRKLCKDTFRLECNFTTYCGVELWPHDVESNPLVCASCLGQNKLFRHIFYCVTKCLNEFLWK